MPNFIDSLLIKIGLDASGVTKGQKEAKDSLEKTAKAADKAQKDIDGAAKKTAESYKKVRDGILEITAAVVAAVAGKEFLAYITASDVAVGRLAKNLSVTTEELSAWEGVARRLGGQTSDADSLFRGVNAMMEDFKLNGGSGSFSPLVRAGLDLSKVMDKSTSYTQRLLMMRDAMRKLSGPDAQRLGQMAGFSEEGLTILVQTDRALEEMLKTQRAMNIETEADRKSAVDRNEAWTNLTETLTGFGRKVSTEFSPLLNGVLGGLKDMLLWMEDHVPVSIGLMGGLGSAILLLKGYSIASFAAQFSGNLATMGGAVGALLGRLGLLGAALSGGWLIGTALSKMGLSDWLADKAYSLFDKNDYNAPVHVQRAAAGATGSPVGIRNNNPGNLNFAGQAGATRAGRFAAFGSMAEGIAAMDDQLQRYAARGNDTVRGIVSTWAPASDHNDTNGYVAAVARALGVDANAHLNLNDANQLRGLIAAMTTQEVGAGRISTEQINAGMALSMQRAGAGASTTHIEAHFNIKSTDPRGVAQESTRELRNFSLASQASRGVS